MKKIAVLTALLFAALQIGYAQKVGLVLSGGGAKGAAMQWDIHPKKWLN